MFYPFAGDFSDRKVSSSAMAKDDDYRRGEGDEEAAAEAPGAPRKRLAWIDWCRTQSVYNVVCGHAWWGALDAMPKAVKDACKPFCGWQGYVDAAGRLLMSETTRMVDYTVDIGALHTGEWQQQQQQQRGRRR